MLVMKDLSSFLLRLIAIALFVVSFVIAMAWIAGFVASILGLIVSALTWGLPLALAGYLWHWVEDRDFNAVIAQAIARARKDIRDAK